MMTYEEALQKIKHRMFETIETDEDWIAIECIEKQIPKKPISDYRYRPKICPFCHDFLENYQNFCDNCGQRIDWSEEA